MTLGTYNVRTLASGRNVPGVLDKLEYDKYDVLDLCDIRSSNDGYTVLPDYHTISYKFLMVGRSV